MFLKFEIFLNVLFILILFISFLSFFGIPSLIEYLDEGVFVKISTYTASEGKVPAPAITICTSDPSTGNAWKLPPNISLSANDSTSYSSVCKGLEGRKLIQCIKNSTYGLDDISVTSLENQNENENEKEPPGYFISDITWAYMGQCHTYIQKEKINSETASLLLPSLNGVYDYVLFVHESDFFSLTANPEAFPGFKMILKNQNQASTDLVQIQCIELIQHNNLNLEKSPCMDDPEYSFSNCLRNAVNMKVGCTLPWAMEKLGKTKIPNCTKMEQFDAQDIIYRFFAAYELRAVLNFTGCKIPCQYREIRAVETPTPFKTGTMNGAMGFALTLVTTDIRVETEALVYNFTSLVSNVGGSLGLFLGFSFYMLWDCILYLFRKFKTSKVIFSYYYFGQITI